MTPVIEQAALGLLRQLAESSRTCVSPHLVRDAQIILAVHNGQGVKPNFCKFMAFRARYPFIMPEDYRDLQTEILLNRKIPAIKQLRTMYLGINKTNLGLKEAKDDVESDKFFEQLCLPPLAAGW